MAWITAVSAGVSSLFGWFRSRDENKTARLTAIAGALKNNPRSAFGWAVLLLILVLIGVDLWATGGENLDVLFQFFQVAAIA